MGLIMETRVNSEVWEIYPRERQRGGADRRGERCYRNLLVERETASETKIFLRIYVYECQITCECAEQKYAGEGFKYEYYNMTRSSGKN
jgi:hypothetical protein